MAQQFHFRIVSLISARTSNFILPNALSQLVAVQKRSPAILTSFLYQHEIAPDYFDWGASLSFFTLACTDISEAVGLQLQSRSKVPLHTSRSWIWSARFGGTPIGARSLGHCIVWKLQRLSKHSRYCWSIAWRCKMCIQLVRKHTCRRITNSGSSNPPGKIHLQRRTKLKQLSQCSLEYIPVGHSQK